MTRIFLSLALAAGFMVNAALAAGEDSQPKDVGWSWEGPFGMYDRNAAQRGLQVYQQVCAACHGLTYVAFRTLSDLGFSEAEVEAIASQYMIDAGYNEFGEPAETEGTPSDYFPAPFVNEEAARFANNGALPPDLSLIIKARARGADYVYSILTGYGEEPPADMETAPGMSYNPYFPGQQIAMPQPLYDGLVQYADGTEASVDQMARDVVTFLQWAGEPKLEERKSMGFKVIIYMAILAVILFFANRRVWAGIKKRQ